MIRLGFLGCGFMGQGVHLPHFLADARCQVLALAEARPRLGQAVAARFGIPRLYASHRDLAADPDLQAVVCITPAELHPAIVGELLAAGKHVYIEKPLAYTLDDGQALIEAAADAGVILMVAYMKRYDPGVRRARELLHQTLSAGDLGGITYARAHCFGGNWIAACASPACTTDEPAPPVERRIPSWLPQHLADPYLTYVNVFCHNINLLRWFLGDEPRVSHAERQGPVVLAHLRFGDVPAVLETGQLPAHRWDESLMVYLERGWVELLTPPPLHREPARVRIYRAAGEHEVIEPLAPWQWAFAAEARHFIDAIEAGTQPLTPGSDALEDLRVCEEVFRRLAASDSR